MIQLLQLTKKFGDLVAVSDLTLQVGRGEFFAVLGPNAAGKTTLIAFWPGCSSPPPARARIAGFDIQTDPLEARRRMAYVPDFPFLYDKLTPLEFFRFTGQIFQMSGARLEESARELMARFNLERIRPQTHRGPFPRHPPAGGHRRLPPARPGSLYN